MKKIVFIFLVAGGIFVSSGATAALWIFESGEDAFTDEETTVSSVKGDGGSYISIGCRKGKLKAVIKFDYIEHFSLDGPVKMKWRADKKEINTITAWRADNVYGILDQEDTAHMAKKLLEAKIFAISVDVSNKTSTRVYDNLENGKYAIGKVLSSCRIEQ